MYRNITRTQDFSNHINIPSPHIFVSKWDLKMNIVKVQDSNDYDVWSKYIKRLVSKTIPSDRIQKEIDHNMNHLLIGYCRKSSDIIGISIPTALIKLIIKYVPKVQARIYQDKWLNVEPEEYEDGLKEIKPPPDAPSSIYPNGWIRKYYYEDLQDHLNREEMVLNNLENNM